MERILRWMERYLSGLVDKLYMLHQSVSVWEGERRSWDGWVDRYLLETREAMSTSQLASPIL